MMARRTKAERIDEAQGIGAALSLEFIERCGVVRDVVILWTPSGRGSTTMAILGPTSQSAARAMAEDFLDSLEPEDAETEGAEDDE